MRIRGERECRDCGTRWSYYETGSVDCPDCGSIRSRGLDDERTLHTEGAATLDLDDVRTDVDSTAAAELADAAGAACREYVRQDGFLNAGELRPLDDIHLAARELAHVADVVGRTRHPTDDEELYLLALLRGADRGERPAPADVPRSLRAARGLAVAQAVRDYRHDVRAWLDGHPNPRTEAEATLTRLDQHARRVRALEGDVAPATAERLVAASRDLTAALRDGDEAALSSARDRLDRLESIRGN
jgi:hypothetical protein